MQLSEPVLLLSGTSGSLALDACGEPRLGWRVLLLEPSLVFTLIEEEGDGLLVEGSLVRLVAVVDLLGAGLIDGSVASGWMSGFDHLCVMAERQESVGLHRVGYRRRIEGSFGGV